jgi:hypothetical protein
MSKFAEIDWPMFLTNDMYAVSRARYSQEEAARLIGEEIDDEVRPGALEATWMRYGYPPADVGLDDPCWFTCSEGRGAQPVWLYG